MNTKLYQLSKDVQAILGSIKAKDSFFEDYVKKQAEKLQVFMEKYNLIKDDLKNSEVESRVVNEKMGKIIDDSKKLLKEIDFRVKVDKKESYKYYFPKNYGSAVKSKDTIIKSFQVILSEMATETAESILFFKESVEILLKELLKNVESSTDTSTDKTFLKKDADNLYKEWNLEYNRLKLLIKAQLLGTNINIISSAPKKTQKKSVKPEENSEK
ncbi:hypothetical protein JXR93_09400 [bacterium]|nr:hypothetical protein [bacterium]